MDTKLRPLFEAAVKDGKVPGIGAFIVDDQGKFLFNESFGNIDAGDGSTAKFDGDTLMQMFSCTKLLTSIAALQLVEQGKIALSDPVEKYVPRISQIEVLESITPGATADDKPKAVLRAPKTKPTVLQLLTHTAGFSYDFFDTPTLLFRVGQGRAPIQYLTAGEWADFETPLVADPGSKFVYGICIDWLGFIISEVSGLSVPEYVERYVTQPLGMTNTHARPPTGKDPLILHIKGEGQQLQATPAMQPKGTPVNWSGGGYLFSTQNDYAKLLVALLNGGKSPVTGKAVLSPESVRDHLFTDLLTPEVDRSGLGVVDPSIPFASNPGTLLPSLSRADLGWSGGLLLNKKDLPYGRRAGSGAWAGLGNLYYWVDPTAKIAGFIGTSILPFLDTDVTTLFDEVERVAYGHDVGGDGADASQRNFSPSK